MRNVYQFIYPSAFLAGTAASIAESFPIRLPATLSPFSPLCNPFPRLQSREKDGSGMQFHLSGGYDVNREPSYGVIASFWPIPIGAFLSTAFF